MAKETLKFTSTNLCKMDLEAEFRIEDGKILYRREEETEWKDLSELKEMQYFNDSYSKLTITEKIQSNDIPDEVSREKPVDLDEE